MSGYAKRLAIPIPTSSPSVYLGGWEAGPSEHAVQHTYDHRDGLYLWYLHSVGALGDSVPMEAGQYHSVTSDMRHVWGTIVAGEPVTSEQSIDLYAVITAAAPDLAGAPPPSSGYRLVANPAIFFGFSAPPAPSRFWTGLVRTSEIV